MKRRDFIKWFIEARTAAYRRMIKTGEMRASEACMGLADAEKDAKKLWRKNREACIELMKD